MQFAKANRCSRVRPPRRRREWRRTLIVNLTSPRRILCSDCLRGSLVLAFSLWPYSCSYSAARSDNSFFCLALSCARSTVQNSRLPGKDDRGHDLDSLIRFVLTVGSPPNKGAEKGSGVVVSERNPQECQNEKIDSRPLFIPAGELYVTERRADEESKPMNLTPGEPNAKNRACDCRHLHLPDSCDCARREESCNVAYGRRRLLEEGRRQGRMDGHW